MNHFLQQIEVALLTIAAKYAPEGSEPRAVVHQWAHAIAGNSDLVCGDDATRIVDHLKAAGIYKNGAASRFSASLISPSGANGWLCLLTAAFGTAARSATSARRVIGNFGTPKLPTTEKETAWLIASFAVPDGELCGFGNINWTARHGSRVV